MTKKNYWVSPSNIGWKVTREGADRAAGTFQTQKAAESYARNLLNNNGGELITQNRQGQIRSKDTINNNDPIPPRDREH